MGRICSGFAFNFVCWQFKMIGLSSSIFASLLVDDFHKRYQVSNDFDSVQKNFQTFFGTLYFFRTETFQDEFVTDLRLILLVGSIGWHRRVARNSQWGGAIWGV